MNEKGTSQGQSQPRYRSGPTTPAAGRSKGGRGGWNGSKGYGNRGGRGGGGEYRPAGHADEERRPKKDKAVNFLHRIS